jgi:hypothetical protein
MGVQADPNYLWHSPFGEPKRLITRGGAGLNAAAARVTRVPPGHPEGYLEGFANILHGKWRAPSKRVQCGQKAGQGRAVSGIEDGVAGMAFNEACVKSSAKNGNGPGVSRGISSTMSYDLMVFRTSAALLVNGMSFLFEWYDQQSEWEEDHSYDDPALRQCAPRLVHGNDWGIPSR